MLDVLSVSDPMMNILLGEQIQRGLGGTLRGGWRLCSKPSTSCSYHKFVSAHATGASHSVLSNTNLMSTMLMSVGDSCGLNSFPFAVFKAQNWQKKKHGEWSQWQVSIKYLGIFFFIGAHCCWRWSAWSAAAWWDPLVKQHLKWRTAMFITIHIMK